MPAGELYIADDPDLAKGNQRAMVLTARFNVSPISDGAA